MSDRNYDRLRHTSKRTRKEFLNVPQGGGWAPIRASMVESAAHRALTLAARHVLDRLLIEHVNHAGRENGRLKVSYNEFQKFGVDRHAIRGALDELIAFGFIKCASPGRRSYGPDPGRVATYRLTFFGVVGSDESGPVTDDWKRLSDNEVQAIESELRDTRAIKKGRKPSATSSAGPALQEGDVISFSPRLAA